VLAGLASVVAEPARSAALVVGVAGLLLLDMATRSLPLPQRSRLIPQQVFSRSLGGGLLRFGVEYGTGFRTLIPSASAYMLALFVLLTNPVWWVTLCLGATFGLARSVAILQFVLLGRDGWVHFLTAHTRMLERAGSIGCAVLLIWSALATTGWM